MSIDVKDVKVEINKPEINFDAMKLNEREKSIMQKKKMLIIGTTVITVGAALASKLLKMNRRTKKNKK